MDLDDFKRLLGEFLKNTKPAMTSQNPHKYPRAVRLNPESETDSDRRDKIERMVMMIHEIEHHSGELRDLWDEANIRMSQITAVKTRFFSMARKLFPTVVRSDYFEDGSGWRMWRNEPWLVSWDTEEGQEDREGEGGDILAS